MTMVNYNDIYIYNNSIRYSMWLVQLKFRIRKSVLWWTIHDQDEDACVKHSRLWIGADWVCEPTLWRDFRPSAKSWWGFERHLWDEQKLQWESVEFKSVWMWKLHILSMKSLCKWLTWVRLILSHAGFSERGHRLPWWWDAQWTEARGLGGGARRSGGGATRLQLVILRLQVFHRHLSVHLLKDFNCKWRNLSITHLMVTFNFILINQCA